MRIPRRHIDWKQYDQFEGSDAAFARSIGMDPHNFAQSQLVQRLLQAAINGEAVHGA